MAEQILNVVFTLVGCVVAPLLAFSSLGWEWLWWLLAVCYWGLAATVILTAIGDRHRRGVRL